MRAVDAAQAVQLVDHHVAQVLEELHPLRVVRQDALVEHVGVRHHDVRARPDRLARVLRRVSVVGERADVGPDLLDHGVQLGELVLRQRLRREQVESARVSVLQDPVEDRQVVAERLARGRGRDHHDVLAPAHALERLALVAVEARVAARLERRPQLRVEGLGEGDDPRLLGREMAQRREHRLVAEGFLDLEALQDRQQGRLAIGAGRQGAWAGRDQLLAHAGA